MKHGTSYTQNKEHPTHKTINTSYVGTDFEIMLLTKR